MNANAPVVLGEQSARGSGAAREGWQGRVLLVAACEPRLAVEAVELVRRYGLGCQLTSLVSARQVAARETLQEAGVACELLSMDREAMWSSLRALRRRRFDLVVVAWGRERGYRSLLFAALIVGFSRLVVLDQRLGPQASRGLARYYARRQARSAGGLAADEAGSAPAADAAPRVVFGQCDTPQVSVIVMAREGGEATLRCLTAVRASSPSVDAEVLVVEAGRGELTEGLERQTVGARFVRARHGNLLRACNEAARRARGSALALLADEAVVEPGWLATALSALRSRPDCGAVGGRLISSCGRLVEAGGIVWRDGSLSSFGRGDDPQRWMYDYAREVDYCSGAALLVDRRAWQEAGGFDERFAPGSCEDVDLCFSVREAGRTVWLQPAAAASLPSSSAVEGGGERPGVSEHFRAKWSARLAEQQPRGGDGSFSARDRHRGPLVMVFDHYVPMPDRDAGSYFMAELLDALVDLGCRVVFWPENLYRLPGYTERLQARGIEVIHGLVCVKDYVRSLGRDVDLALAHRARIAAHYLPEIREHCAAQAYLAADLEHLRETRRFEVEGQATATAVVEGLRRREGEILRTVDLVTVHSPVERALLERDFPGVRVMEMPLPSPCIRPGGRSFDERRDMIFVGSTHPPNVDAVVHFVDRILPQVREQIGDVRLNVVGEVCRDLQPLAQRPGVQLVGYVEDLPDRLDRARVFVSPLRYGAGIKGKILTALKAGLPVVTTAVGAEGIGLQNGRSALVAEEEGHFARLVSRLYTDPALWARLRAGGLELVDQRHSQAIFRRTVQQLVEGLLAGAATLRPEDEMPRRLSTPGHP